MWGGWGDAIAESSRNRTPKRYIKMAERSMPNREMLGLLANLLLAVVKLGIYIHQLVSWSRGVRGGNPFAFVNIPIVSLFNLVSDSPAKPSPWGRGIFLFPLRDGRLNIKESYMELRYISRLCLDTIFFNCLDTIKYQVRKNRIKA